MDLDSDFHNREEALGANVDGFRAWINLRFGINIPSKGRAFELSKSAYWDHWLDELEYGAEAARELFQSNHP